MDCTVNTDAFVKMSAYAYFANMDANDTLELKESSASPDTLEIAKAKMIARIRDLELKIAQSKLRIAKDTAELAVDDLEATSGNIQFAIVEWEHLGELIGRLNSAKKEMTEKFGESI